MIDLSIIIPIYNVEKYIRPCIESIYRQGLNENQFEVIIVNDGTKDKSMEMIADIIPAHSNITVINQENQGLSVARNNGIAIAKGEYILMPDSDDMLIDYSVKPLLEKALAEKADIIMADFVQMNDEEINNIPQHPIKQQEAFKTTEISGKELLNEYYCRWYWRSVYRRKFLHENNISFVPGIYAQDVPFTNECFLKVKKCLRTSWLLNIYRRGHESASSLYSLKRANDTSIAIRKSWELSRSLSLSPETAYQQDELLFSLFYLHICAIEYGHLRGFVEVCQAINFLKEQIPHLTFNHNKRQRMWAFMYNQLPVTVFAFIIYSNRKLLRKLLRKLK